MFINYKYMPEEYCADQSCRDPFHHNVLHRCPMVGQAPDTAHVTGTVTHMAFPNSISLGGNAEWQPLF